MNCKKPFVRAVGEAYGCGQCLPCRIKMRRMWTHRYMLEAAQYSDNAFVTLTYDPEKYDGETLVIAHYQNWLKRLRAAVAPHKFRFALVGEYGDETQRPHYHALLFNFATCLRGRTKRIPGTSRPDWSRCCPRCKLVGDTWRFGDVDLGNLETSSAQYVAKYTTKKMTSKDDPRLFGRHPEFARRSLKPGLGHGMLHDLASQIMALNLDTPQGDVPSSLRHGGRMMPLGRYLRRQLRLLLGKEANATPETLLAAKARLLVMLENYEGTPYDPLTAGLNFTQRLKNATSQKVLQIEGRDRIFKKKGEL